jgi:hypothetical protein
VGLCKNRIPSPPVLPVEINVAYHSPGKESVIADVFFIALILDILCNFIVALIIIIYNLLVNYMPFPVVANGEYKNSSRLRASFLSSYTKAEAGYNP